VKLGTKGGGKPDTPSMAREKRSGLMEFNESKDWRPKSGTQCHERREGNPEGVGIKRGEKNRIVRVPLPLKRHARIGAGGPGKGKPSSPHTQMPRKQKVAMEKKKSSNPPGSGAKRTRGLSER